MKDPRDPIDTSARYPPHPRLGFSPIYKEISFSCAGGLHTRGRASDCDLPAVPSELGPSGWQPRNLTDMEEEGLTLHLGRKLLELTLRVGEEEELDPQMRLIFIATCVGLVSKG